MGLNNDTWSVGVGDLKWNIRLWDWTWCGDSGTSCKTGEVRDAVELDIIVQNMGGGSASKKAGSNKTVSLGSAELQLSTEVQTDCVWQDMAADYPMVTTQGSSTTITFRFPKLGSCQSSTCSWGFVYMGVPPNPCVCKQIHVCVYRYLRASGSGRRPQRRMARLQISGHYAYLAVRSDLTPAVHFCPRATAAGSLH